jgi:AcrR family transcriptional regulator
MKSEKKVAVLPALKLPVEPIEEKTAGPRLVRRSQAERTSAMRERLKQAAIACLEAHGYAGFSISDVVQRACVTRGALFHHFSGRTELIAEALAWHQRRVWMEERDELLAAIVAGATLEAQLRIAWRHAQRRAAIDTEMMAAMRADRELAQAWKTVNARDATVEPRFNTTPVAWTTLAGDPTPELTRFLVGFFLTGMQALAPFNTPEMPEQALIKLAQILELASTAMTASHTGGDTK